VEVWHKFFEMNYRYRGMSRVASKKKRRFDEHIEGGDGAIVALTRS
jgi:hypothetical protein